MGNKIFGGVVLLLWGSSMTWLVVAKILPPFFNGEPPVATLARSSTPTAWRLSLNNRPCGSAVALAAPGASGSTEVLGRLRIEAVPLPEVAPKWMRGILSHFDEVSLDMRTRTTFDTMRNLAAFESRIQVNETPSLIGMNGVVEGDRLRVRLRSGAFTKETEHPWRAGQMLAGELMPNSRLTNLRVGKKWQTEVYSPFGPPNSPLSMIEAEVVAEDNLLFCDEFTPIFHIVYRDAKAAGVSAADRVRREVWVAKDGRVLRSEVSFLNAHLRFDRLPDAAAEQMADASLEMDRYATTTTPEGPAPAGETAAGR